MRFRAKLTITMVLLLSLTYGIGGSLMIAQSFSSSIARERDTAVQTYRMVVDVLDLLGDNASPGTAANTVALVLHKLGSGGAGTAARGTGTRRGRWHRSRAPAGTRRRAPPRAPWPPRR